MTKTPPPPADSAATLLPPKPTAAELGYRLPAEWEPLARVWISRPHNAETWPGCLPQAQAEFDHFVRQLSKTVTVTDVAELGARTDDSWARDYGPIFVKDAKGHVACHDFVFNNWGGKYGSAAQDDAVAGKIAAFLGLPCWRHQQVLEGGSIEVNGRGTVMTSEACLLNTNRNRALTKPQIEALLHAALGTKHTIWLGGGIAGDDTDGHIDQLARFVAPDTVVAPRTPTNHMCHQALEANWARLASAKDQDGQPLKLIALPMPQTRTYAYPADSFGPGGTNPLPACHANFLISNGSVFVPIFDQGTDQEALDVLAHAMPNHQIVGIPSRHLIVGFGSLHCLTMQQAK
ncbi:MAG: agmatine deiminase family protein [Phycisphaeraceae bacterium]|nr:agmatine deiminase family protein [Phycisphaeraceae bacterium]